MNVVTDLERSDIWNLIHDTLDERRLAFAVLAYKRHLFATFDGKGYIREYSMRPIILAQFIADNRIIATAKTGRKLEVHRLVVDLIDLDGHDFLQLLDATLHLNRLGWLVPETLDKVLDVGDLFLLVFVSAQLLFASFGSQHHILIVWHLVILCMATGNLDGSRCNIVDESTVVTDKDHRFGLLSQKLLEPLNGIDIQVVGRFIEQQHIGPL